MTPDDSFEVPFETDEAQTANNDGAIDDADVNAAKDAWERNEIDPASGEAAETEGKAPAEDDDPQLAELAQPFVGQWNQLISTTNWEKGRIISEWREALVESGVSATQYSDDAWARRVGGVTAPHVGRLRRVHDRFASTYETYDRLYWSHFLAALDWDDAPLWLEGASREKWSVSAMREQRWEAHGAVESQRPTNSQIVEVDTDEDVVLPAQGGGRTKEYGDEPNTSAGPKYDEPDFGDEEELMSMAGPKPAAAATDEADSPAVQPFVGLPELPDDLADAVETLKLSILRHKADGWRDVEAETVKDYLNAIGVLIES